MNAGTVTVKERDLMGHATVTIKVERSTGHRFLLWGGLQLMKFGALVAGVGVVVIEGEAEIHGDGTGIAAPPLPDDAYTRHPRIMKAQTIRAAREDGS